MQRRNRRFGLFLHLRIGEPARLLEGKQGRASFASLVQHQPGHQPAVRIPGIELRAALEGLGGFRDIAARELGPSHGLPGFEAVGIDARRHQSMLDSAGKVAAVEGLAHREQAGRGQPVQCPLRIGIARLHGTGGTIEAGGVELARGELLFERRDQPSRIGLGYNIRQRRIGGKLLLQERQQARRLFAVELIDEP